MPSLAAVKAFNSSFSISYVPVAVFIGGTSGVGRSMAEAFARYTRGNAQIVIAGRNQQAADEILASLPKPSSTGWRHEFVPCEASLMKNIAKFTTDIRQRFPRINYLVISSGYASLLGRNDTEEGIDVQLALRYYGRWKFVHELLPSLRAAHQAGEASSAMLVLDPARGIPIDAHDFGLKRKYSGMTAMRVSCTYTDMALQEFALRDPAISFTHIHPGFVNTPLYDSSHWAMRLVRPLVRMTAIFPAVCAEYMLFALLNGEPGFSRRDDKGDVMGKSAYVATEEERKALWEHTAQEVRG
ncbi:hypothetical protein R3P38DRAFT_2549638 [Favolaschia claudopus]|uniref:NAD(P)-binding protein n=1 Tax=Favolaschia claudopus TaxID=2862362 RepID=A0AAW0AHW7_9AGAR